MTNTDKNSVQQSGINSPKTHQFDFIHNCLIVFACKNKQLKAGGKQPMTTKHNQTNTDTRNGKEGVVSTNLTEGFTDNPHNQAENKKPYTPQIRAETPPTHQKLTTLLQRAIDSYALGNTKAGENYLAEAWPIAQNAIQIGR